MRKRGPGWLCQPSVPPGSIVTFTTWRSVTPSVLILASQSPSVAFALISPNCALARSVGCSPAAGVASAGTTTNAVATRAATAAIPVAARTCLRRRVISSPLRAHKRAVPVRSSLLLPSGRDRIDDADGVDFSALRGERSVAAGGGVEDEEADLVLGNMDRAFEADACRPLRQLLGGQAGSALAGPTLSGLAAREVGLDYVARHALDATQPALRWK